MGDSIERERERDGDISAHERGEYGAVFVVVDNEGEASFELLEDLMSWHGAPIAQCPVRLDHEQSLVPALDHPVLLIQMAQILQIPHEIAVHVVHTREQTAIPQPIVITATSNRKQIKQIERRIAIINRIWLPSVGGGVGRGVGQHSLVDELNGEAIFGIGIEEILQSVVRSFGSDGSRRRRRAVKLARRLNHAVPENSQHICSEKLNFSQRKM